MYGWGYDDAATWNKGGYDYGSAKKPYLDEIAKEAAAKGPRVWESKKQPDMSVVGPQGKTIITQSETPVIFGIDGTGSMQTWPAEIFDRLPLAYQTLSKYKDGLEMCFSVIGDASWDRWPLQVSPFGKGAVLDDYLKAVHAEGKGGPGIRESYELWAYFMLEHCETPNAQGRPLMFLMGDEMFYDVVKPDQVMKHIGDKIQATDARGVWNKLADKYDIWLLRKSYEGNDNKIVAQWGEVLGPQRIIPVYDPERVVDVAVGTAAKLWGEMKDFDKNLSARQEEDAKKVVYASLRYVDPAAAATAKSGAGSKKSVKL